MSKLNAVRMRSLTIGLSVLLVLVGMSRTLSWGTLSAFGLGKFATVCPLGYLETSLTSRLCLPRLLAPFLALMLVTVLLGRVFCGWVCPVPLVKSWLPTQKKHGSCANGEPKPIGASIAEATTESSQPARPQTGLYVLTGALLSSAVFGFPVFCLVCPIGLSFATLFAVMRLFRFNEPTVALIVFPAIVFVELVVLRKWCSRLCPIGALLGLVSRINRSLVPSVDKQLCLVATEGKNCQICRNACEMSIDLRSGSRPNTSDCIKCRDCAEKCPVQAIRFPLWRKS
jgi:ferredoxin-type protein NapH